LKTRKVRLKRKDEPEKVTRKGMVVFVVLVLLSLVAFVVGVRMGVARKDAKLLGSADMKTRGLYYQLKMERTNYHLGEPIKVQLTITNISSSPINLKFQKNLEFDLTVRKEVDLLFAQVPKTIWKLSENQMVYADSHDTILDPGKTVSFNGVWDQKDRDGQSVKPGNYQIIGNLLADDRPESLSLRGKTIDE
jgi:hypothetical protein